MITLFYYRHKEYFTLVDIICGFYDNLLQIVASLFSFIRCLPLPSSEWTETIGDAFCHGHRETQSLYPHQESDILIGEETVLVQESGLVASTSNSIILEQQPDIVNSCRYTSCVPQTLLYYVMYIILAYFTITLDTMYHLGKV